MATEEFFDCDPDELHKGGFDIVAPGFYVGLVTSHSEDDRDNHIFEFRIVCAPKGREAEIGKSYREWVAKNNKEGNRKKRLAIATSVGLTTLETVKALQSAGKPVPIDWDASVGRVLCFEIAQEDGDDGKTRNKVPYWNFYSVNDPKHSKRFPVDHKAIAAAIDEFQQQSPESDPWDTEGRGVSGGNSNGGNQQSQPPAAHAAADTFDPFA